MSGTNKIIIIKYFKYKNVRAEYKWAYIHFFVSNTNDKITQ